MATKPVQPPAQKKVTSKCPSCGSTSLMKQGFKYSKSDKTNEYPIQRYKCKNCNWQGALEKVEYPVKIVYNIPKVRHFETIRIIVLSDTHCGHEEGVAPRGYWCENRPELQENYEWLKAEIDRFKPYNICVSNGDAIDGRGDKSGGTELIISDLMDQAKAASEVMMLTGAKKYYCVSGTDYHVGKAEQFERVMANDLLTDLHDQLTLEVNGKLLHFKHHTGKSSSPFSTTGTTIKQAMWMTLNNQQYDVVIRSHVHEYNHYEQWSERGYRHIITTPGLQMNSRYGRRRMSSYCHYGFIVIDIDKNGLIRIQPIIKEPKEQEIISYGHGRN